MNIKIGDKVRSFDFADGDWGRDLTGERACFVEGVVVDIIEPGDPRFADAPGFSSCTRYQIFCDKRIFGGEEVEPEDCYFYPPVNGTPSWGDKVINIVERIDG